jgi:ATP-dependent Lhr-like helicase
MKACSLLTSFLTVRDAAGNVTQFGYEVPNQFFFVQPWFFSNGTSILNEDWTASNMLDPKVSETLQFLHYLLRSEPDAPLLVAATARREELDRSHPLNDLLAGLRSLERLTALTDQPFQRIGLSATQRPLEEIARFLGGFAHDGTPRPVDVVDAGVRKPLDLEVIVPVEDMAELGAELGAAADPQDDPRTRGADRLSIWPSIHPVLLELIRTHRSTIVFVNNRRSAERLSSRLNDLAEEDLVRAHHGSIARDQRILIEDGLKEGRLRAIVATSSLELGIDMGAVDLVVQVESPDSVASGLQRIGRAGHQVGAPSVGKLIPKYRGDLLQTAVVAERMLAADIEATRYPRNPLDVLAQQLVAMTAVEEWRVEDLYAAVRACANFADLSRDVFTAVLDLLAGRYPSDAFAGLRPRVVWDRAADTVRAREGAGRIAITSGGTIPDRGLFGVFMPDGTRVGELDEECVYESRRGEVILLGASAWRIEDITRDRVVVSPAPGEQGKLPFWKAPGPGRPIELGRAIGRFTRELRSAGRDDAMTRLRDGIGLDAWAAANLVNYIDEQSEATGGAVPDDRTIVVERFRDELGDWRVCILSPFGSRVHAPWSLAIEARVQERLGPGAQVLWSDDGIVLRLPEAVERIPVEDLVFGPEEIEETVVAALPGTAMFATVFREVAARALAGQGFRPPQATELYRLQSGQTVADLDSEEVTAFVTLRAGAAVEIAALITHCRERLASYKYPRRVTVLDALPKGATGKVLKARLPDAVS